MNTILQDLRLALRQISRSPGFAATAVLILALGIAANVIVFGVVQGLILRPLEIPHPEQVRTLGHTNQGFPAFSYPEVRDVHEGNTVFSAVATFNFDQFGMEASGVTRPVWGYQVTGQYFEVAAIQPFLGRLLQRGDDDRSGDSEVVVLSWPTWKNDFGADPEIVGKVIRLSKHPYTVVGVTPEGFYGTEKIAQPSVYVPMPSEEVDWLEDRHNLNFFGIVRMKDGVTMPQVQADLDAIAARARKQFPKEEEKLGYKLVPVGMMGDFIGAAVRRFLVGMMAMAGIVLLAACANLGSLFAARTADRTREIAIRMAIGSSRWRVLRQVLVEAFVISILGGAGACGLSWLALTELARWHPPTEYPMRFIVQPDASLVLIALLISMVAAVLFGVMPLRQIFKADPNDAIKSGSTQSQSGRRWALRDVLLAAQVALCCVTVTAAFVALRGLSRSMTMDMGFHPTNAVMTTFDLSQAAYTEESAARFQRQLQEKVAQLPGVEAVGYANTTPLNGDTSNPRIYSQQTTDFKPSNSAFDAFAFRVSPGYFAAAGTQLLAGRELSFNDNAKAPAVAVVNEQFARHLFPADRGHAENAVGRYFKDEAGVSVEIVGVVVDGKYFLLSEDPQEAMFFPTSQKPDRRTSFIVRTQREPGEMAANIRNVMRDLDPAVPIRESGSWKSQLGLALFPSQVATVALGLFGAFGLLLSITGTFGLASYTVSKRLRELSIRVALGAQAKQIFSAALGRMMVLLIAGSVIGLALGVAASRVLSAIVYQASAHDPFVLAAVAFTILLTGTLSVMGPVRRALHVDPANVLREQ